MLLGRVTEPCLETGGVTDKLNGSEYLYKGLQVLL